MSERREGGRRQTSGIRRSTLFPLVAAVGIGALMLSMLVYILPAFLNDSPNDPFDIDSLVEMTPGAEEDELRERVEENPDDVDAIVILADLLVNTGRRNEAIPLFERAVQQRPDDATLRTAFGRTLSQQGYSLDAEIQLMRAHELAPDDPEPLYLLGQVYESWNPPRDDDARETFDQVVETAPESVYAERARDRLSELGANH